MLSWVHSIMGRWQVRLTRHAARIAARHAATHAAMIAARIAVRIVVRVLVNAGEVVNTGSDLGHR